MTQCTQCGKYRVEYDTYFHRYRCFDCGWTSELCHESPNRAEVGSFVYDAEEWCLAQGLKIPDQHKQRRMFQGMCDDFQERR
jgi:hypothetical protein